VISAIAMIWLALPMNALDGPHSLSHGKRAAAVQLS